MLHLNFRTYVLYIYITQSNQKSNLPVMAHQDWKPLVLGKPKTKPTQNETEKQASSQTQHKSLSIAAANPRRLEEDDNYRIPQVDFEMGRKITCGRVQMKLSQEQLAKKCSIPLAIVKEYEQGKGLYNRAYLDPICRVLNIVVSKHHPK